MGAPRGLLRLGLIRWSLQSSLWRSHVHLIPATCLVPSLIAYYTTMSSQNKRPKLSEAGSAPLSSSQTTGLKSPPKGQSKIQSFFKSTPAASAPSMTSASKQAAILEALDVDESELCDLSSFQASTPAPSQPRPAPSHVIPSQSANTSMDSATTVGASFLDLSMPEVPFSSNSRIFEMDAEEQRELDKTMKQREKNREKYSFLDDPLDAMRRKRTDPDYDPRTLHIPANSYYNMTDFERQYWDIKSKYFNYVVFFQKGIFYEIMEADADIASLELGIAPMHRAGMRSTGFSMKDGDSNAEKLVQRGYSVVLVDQVESPVDRARSADDSNPSLGANSTQSRLSASTSTGSGSSGSAPPASPSNPKKRKAITPEPEKMLKRVVRRILTPGTTPEAAVESARPVFLLSICEKVESIPLAHTTFGVCLFDTSVGSFIVGDLEEDDIESFTKLRTLLFHSRPREVLFCKGAISKQLNQILKLYCHENVLMRPRRETTEAHTNAVITQLNELRTSLPSDSEPPAIQRARDSPLSLNALSLTFDFLDETKNLEALQHASWLTMSDYRRSQSGSHMILDSRALENLALLEGEDRGPKNSIFGFLDRTVTRFGRRRLFQWTCHPLQNPYQVESRLDSVEFLMNHPELGANLRSLLLKFKTLDLERFLALSCASRLQLKQFVDLTDSLHAVSSDYNHIWKSWLENGFADSEGNSDPLPRELRSILSAFDGVPDTRVRDELGATTHWHLRTLEFPEVAVEPDAHLELVYFREAFDRPSYAEDKKLIPTRGMCAPYDEAMDRLDAVNAALAEETDSFISFYRSAGIRTGDGSTQISMVDAGNVHRVIEVPASWVSQAGVPPGAREQSAKSNAKLKRFYTPRVEDELLLEWKEAVLFGERAAGLALETFARRLASCARLWWRPWIRKLSEIDCLLSLASASQSDSDMQVRPKVFAVTVDRFEDRTADSNGAISVPVLEIASSPFIAIQNCVHPLLATSAIARSFSSTVHLDDPAQAGAATQTRVISNDIVLGPLPDCLKGSESGFGIEVDGNGYHSKSNPSAILLTGPNMGGKSTLLRQVCLAVTMAQIGCFPFGKLSFTTVDRVFTRIGASDNIFAGRSTFMVELEEASVVLKYATDRSLVILDELGRGTATFDGYAIAYATLSHLALQTRCFVIFSTHYHLLTSEVETHELLRRVVSLFYMDALVDAHQHTVTFLYKMVLGVCPKSYGMMVAAMAKIPRDVVRTAQHRSSAFQAEMASKQLQNKDLKVQYLQLASLVRSLVIKSESI